MSEAVRWGVLGCARIATHRWILGLLQADNATLWAVASRDQVKADATRQQFGARIAYDNYDALLADPDVEAVYIPLPNHLHKAWAIAALRAGKHVLCEKPIALNAVEAREMQAAARDSGRYLLEAFMYRLGPLMQRAIEIVRSGRLGELRALHTSFTFLIADDPNNVRLKAGEGGGAMYDVGCYCLNALRMMAGREPLTAHAKLVWSERYGVDMGGAGVLDFGDGLLGTFNTGFNAGWNNYLRVAGAQGVLEAPLGFLGRGDQAELIVAMGDERERIIIPLVDAYKLEVEDLGAAIRGERRPRFADEPLDANMRALDACYASDHSGQTTAV